MSRRKPWANLRKAWHSQFSDRLMLSTLQQIDDAIRDCRCVDWSIRRESGETIKSPITVVATAVVYYAPARKHDPKSRNPGRRR